MIDELSDLVRDAAKGLLFVVLLIWALASYAYDALFVDRTVAKEAFKVEHVDWHQSDYGAGDQQFSIVVQYRNLSALRLTRVDADYVVSDCKSGSNCEPVDRGKLSNSLDTPASLAGGFPRQSWSIRWLSLLATSA